MPYSSTNLSTGGIGRDVGRQIIAILDADDAEAETEDDDGDDGA